jgi:putative transposase
MARRRLFIRGLSHHVIHRGNNRGNVFIDDRDRRQFLWLLRKAATKCRVEIHCYVLMRTHYHLIATAHDDKGLSRMMQSLGRRYVRYFNDRHRRTGTLWEGRYRASLIGDERYWLTCLRYIELNPVRAGIVSDPRHYEWSSARAHACQATDIVLTPHRLYLQLGPDAEARAAQWSEICGHPLAEAELDAIRTSARKSTAIGASSRRKPKVPAAS